MLMNNVYYSGPGYGPEDSHIQVDIVCNTGRKEGRKEALQKMNTL